LESDLLAALHQGAHQERAGRHARERDRAQRRGLVHCRQALRDAGAPEGWMVRPHVDKPKALCIVGTFA
jgi:hypothetical protein